MSDDKPNPQVIQQNQNNDINLVDISQKLDVILASISANRLEVTEYMNVNDRKVDAITERVDQNDSKFEELESRLAALEKAKPCEAVLTHERELLKQQQLKDNVCLHGIPYRENENLKEIVKAVGNAIKVRIGSSDIVRVHRTKPSEKSPGLIVVKLSSFDMKLKVMEAKRSTAKLTVGHLKLRLEQSNSPIYINHQMTPFYSSLFYKARQAAADGYCKTCWINGSGLSIRMNDDSVVAIKSADELESLASKQSPCNSSTASFESAPDTSSPRTHPVKSKPKTQNKQFQNNKRKRREDNCDGQRKRGRPSLVNDHQQKSNQQQITKFIGKSNNRA